VPRNASPPVATSSGDAAQGARAEHPQPSLPSPAPMRSNANPSSSSIAVPDALGR
jgi:hypothetical protein